MLSGTQRNDMQDSLVNTEVPEDPSAPKPLARSSRSTLCDGPTITAILSLVNAALGAGVLAYPFAFMSAGMVAANAFTVIIGTLSFLSLTIVMHSMTVMRERHGNNVCSYGDLVRHALGPGASVLLEVLILIYTFGSCVGYLEVLENIVDGIVSESMLAKAGLTRDQERTYAIGGAAILCFGLSTLRSIAALKYSAAAGVAAVLFTVGTLIYQAATDPCKPNDCTDEPGRHGWTPGELGVSAWPESFSSCLKSLPLIAFAMQCHIQCAQAYCEMPLRLQRSASGRRSVAIGAVLLTLILYFPAGIAGFVRFGDATRPDILYNFAVTDVAADIAKVCMALTALSAFPCQHYPARTIILKIMRKCSGAADMTAPMSLPFALVEAALFVAAVFGVALWATLNGIKLDIVIQIIGAVCASAVIMIIPGILWARLGTGAPSAPSRVLPALMLVCVGTFIMLAGMYATIDGMLAGHHNATGAPPPPPAVPSP